jgi:hypothetical protein
MHPCATCHRHIRATETTCPFCGALLHASEARTPSLAFALAGVLALASCSSNEPGNDEANTTTAMSTTTDDVDTTNTTVDTTNATDDASTEGNPDTSTDPTTVTTNEGGSFYAGPSPDGWPSSWCDPFAQDCPEGEKCVPYDSGSGTWDANKCVPITGAGQTGDPCVSGGVIEATDDCDGASFCFHVDERGQGTCTAFCQGTAEMPECQPGSGCSITNDGSITACLDLCEPLLQDCEPGFGCYWNGGTALFCVEAGAGAAGDECGWINSCAPGLGCIDGLCTSFCDLGAPSCEPGTECLPLFEPGEAPGYDHVGVCVSP